MTEEKSIFNTARQIGSREARRQYLVGACDGDPALLARVEALLRVYDEGDTFLHRPAIDFNERDRELPGEEIWPYKPLSRLGEGGMGVVYLADQEHPVRRQVALKLIRPGADSRQVVARFEAERAALALMDHPNIAKVFDAGVTPSGRSYFVMELVRGVPITRYCDEHRLTLRDRLRLFVQVCLGVQHAHQKGIIHRDLKPSNVLVTVYDGKPVPKIIDFGLAKPTQRENPEETLLTQIGAIVGTPDYMSPEQADASRCDIDTRSDIYSLGVLLYELLTGTTPLQGKGADGRRLLEVLERLRDEEPTRPSARLGTSPELTVVAAARNVEPARLVGLVRGDLDWIVLKCLEKDRTRRYETSDGLAKDVERYLRYEPVEASPPSQSYRLRKFARRHRAALATAAAFVLLLLGGVAVSTWLAVRANDAEQKAVTERDRKEDARGQARRALDQLTDEVVERLMVRQVQLTEEDRVFLRQVLAMHEEFAHGEGDRPEVRASTADARFRIGLIRHKLGEYHEAEEAYRSAANVQRNLAAEFRDRPVYRSDLAKTHRRLGVLLRETGRPRDAEEVCTAAVDIMWKLDQDYPDRPEYRRDLAAGHTNLGNIQAATNRMKEAETSYRSAVDILRGLSAASLARPEDRRLLAGSYQNLGNVYYQTNRFKQGEECYVNARDILQKLADEVSGHPDDRRDLAKILGNLGAVYASTQRRLQAEESFRNAANVIQKLADEYPTRPDYRSLMASSRSNLGNLLTRLKRYPQAEEAYTAARAGYERLADDFPLVSEYQADLGKVLAGLAFLKSLGKDHAAASKLLKQASVRDQAALRVEPKNPTYREAYRTHLAVLAEVHGSANEHVAAADTADELARFNFDPAADTFTAAWVTVRCVDLAREDNLLAVDEGEALARAYADRAMAHLQAAVRHGFKDITRLKKNRDFDPLRSRNDFRKLLLDLDAASARP